MTEQRIIYITSISELLTYNVTDVCFAIGFFDGVHLGHRLLLDRLQVMAEEKHAEPVALTFWPQPRQVLNPRRPPEVLLSQADKAKLLEETGVRAVVTIPFTESLAAQDPEAFISECFASGVKIHGICVGKGFRFGAGGKGDSVLLRKLAESHGAAFDAVSELSIGSGRISSTGIREAIRAGRLEDACKALGRMPALYGHIRTGFHVATTRLHCPTANLNLEYGVLPPNGVYAGMAVYNGERYPAAVNIGVSPTFQNHGLGAEVRVEVHLLDRSIDLYGAAIRVDLAAYLRPEVRFRTPDALMEQISRDVAEIRKILRKETEKNG